MSPPHPPLSANATLKMDDEDPAAQESGGESGGDSSRSDERQVWDSWDESTGEVWSDESGSEATGAVEGTGLWEECAEDDEAVLTAADELSSDEEYETDQSPDHTNWSRCRSACECRPPPLRDLPTVGTICWWWLVALQQTCWADDSSSVASRLVIVSLKSGKVVVMLQGRHAGKKAVIVRQVRALRAESAES